MRKLVSGFCLCLLLAGGAAAQQASAGLMQLHDDLRLSADQEGAWRDYTAAIAPNAQVQARHRAADQLLPQLTTPRRIALIEATMAADNADFRLQAMAVTAFYERLTPAQQRIFDEESLSGASAGTGAGPGRPLQAPPPHP